MPADEPHADEPDTGDPNRGEPNADARGPSETSGDPSALTPPHTPPSGVQNEESKRLDAAKLPPIEPPSAGFIVQLFVVPAIIVAVVIGAYLLFVKGASRQVDWLEMAARLHDNNATIRLKAANSLAELLNAQQVLESQRLNTENPSASEGTGQPSTPLPDEEPLHRNQQLAEELAKALNAQLDRQSASVDAIDRNFQEFLIKAIGKMDVPEVALPPLRRARRLEHPELKKYAAIGILQVVAMSHERQAPVKDAGLLQEVLAASEDSTDVLRAIAVSTLAFLPGDESQQRLTALLSHPDSATRMSAAVAMVQFDSTAGLGVFEQSLRQDHTILHLKRITSKEEDDAFFERQQQVRMAMRGVERLLPQLSAEEKESFTTLIKPYCEVADVGVQQQAFTTLERIQAATVTP